MKKYVNGEYLELTAEELAALREQPVTRLIFPGWRQSRRL